jgi:hypothetical protein
MSGCATVASLPVVSHTGERLFAIDAAAFEQLACVYARALARFREHGGTGTPAMQVATSKRVTQTTVLGDAFLMWNCDKCTGDVCLCGDDDAPPPDESSNRTGPVRGRPITQLPDSCRVAMDYQSGELYVLSAERQVTFDLSSRVPFLPHVHTEVRLSCPESDHAITVRTLTGKAFALVVSPTETVAEVMGKIREREGIPLDQQRLIYAGKQLDKGLALADYNVRDGATLHLVLRMRGGMAHWTSSRQDYERLFLETFRARPTYGTVLLHVRLLSGRDVPFHVAADLSVDELKRAIVRVERESDVDRLLASMSLAHYGDAIKAMGGASIVHLRFVTDDDLAAIGMHETERAVLLGALI